MFCLAAFGRNRLNSAIWPAEPVKEPSKPLPLQSRQLQRRSFCSPCEPLLRIVRENKTVGQQYFLGQDPVSHSSKLYHQAGKDKKLPNWWKEPLMSWLHSLLLFIRSGGETVNAFSDKKALATSQPIFKLKSPMSFSRGWFLWKGKDPDQTPLVPHYGTSNGGKASRRSFSLPICHIPLQWTVFCFREVKSKLEDLLLSQRSLMTNLEGVVQMSSKNQSTTAFWRWMDCCEQFVRISLNRPKKVLK